MTRIVYLTALGAVLAYFLVANPALSRPVASVNGPEADAAPLVLATTTDASYNWSGYVADDGEYTAVSATWELPESRYPAGASGRIAADATWVGIGGVRTRDLIQAGTQALVDETGATQYSAWYEVLPAVAQPVDLDVGPGDSVSVAVTYVGHDLWHISFVNNTSSERLSLTVPYQSSFSSAEWVQEAPSLALPNGRASMPLTEFDRVTFANASVVEDGQAKTLVAAGAEPLRMQNRLGHTLAAPSVVSGASDFSVVRSDAASVPLRRVNIIIIGP